MTAQWGADANILGWQRGDIGGTGTTAATLAAVRTYLIDTYLPDGLGSHGKLFDGGSGWHTTYSSFAASGYGGEANERHPVICAKSHTAASFNTLMTDMAAALPDSEIWYACFYSEPEAGFNSGALTHSTYQSTWAEMDTLRTAHPHGAQVKFIPILMAFQEISGTSHWSTFLTPVLAVADAIGWDVYDDNGDPQSWSFETDIYPAIQDLQTTSGLPWSIPEYGLQVSNHSGSTDNAAGVLARWEAMVAVCEADDNFLWGNYWMDGPHAPNQRSAVIRTNPASAAYLAALVGGDLAPEAPANDNFAAATELTGTAGTIHADTTHATTETNEPLFNGGDSAVGATLWWTYTPPADGVLGVTPTGAGWTPLIDLSTGSSINTLTQLATGESLSQAVVGGTTYYIRVGSADGSSGLLTLAYSMPVTGFIGGESFHTHGGSAYLGAHVGTITGAGWSSNLRSRSAVATIDIGDTPIDGLTFTNDQALLEPDWQLLPPSLPNGPAAHIIQKMWLDISGPPTFDNHHQPHAGSWPGTGGHPAKALHADWGHYRIKVGTKNVTSFRGAQTVITQLSHTDPFGDDTCSLTFPMIGPYEHRGNPGTDLHWLPGTDDDRHIPVTIHHVMHDGTVTTQFEGDISSIVDSFDGKSGPLVVNATGLLKTLDQRITKPRFNSDPIDIGRLIHQWTAYEAKYGWHGHPCPARHTGIPTAERGGYGDPLMTTTIQNLLASAQTGDGTKWTIRNHRPRGMRLHIRDLTTVHFTLWCGQPGVTHQLTRDLDQAVRAIFGEGQAHDIQSWRNTQYPNAQDNPPHYPLTAGAVFNPGDSHTGLGPFTDELNSRGYHLDSHDTYQASDANNIRAFQGDAGINVDGAIGPQTWNAAFADTNNSHALDAYIRPLAVTPAAEPFLYNGRGGRIGRNPDYDHRTRREKLEQFGTLSKDDARRSAHLEMPVVSHSDYAGTVTLTNIDPPEVGALSIKAGWNFTFKNHAGVDRLLHIAKVDINPGMTPGTARTVTLTTSERGDDYITLAARMQRNRDVVDMSGRRRPSHRSSKHTPDFAPFDSESGAGFLTPRAQFGGLWNVYPIPAGELGSIVHVRLVANTPTLIAAAVFNRRVTARQLTALPGLADPSSGAAGGNDPWKVNAHKLTRNLKYADQPRMAWATGGPGAMQGYWPNDPSAGDSDITGVLDDSSPWNFHSARAPWLWLAVWTRDSCRIGGDPDYDHRALFPGPPP